MYEMEKFSLFCFFRIEMSKLILQKLEWDSDFFGFQVCMVSGSLITNRGEQNFTITVPFIQHAQRFFVYLTSKS